MFDQSEFISDSWSNGCNVGGGSEIKISFKKKAAQSTHTNTESNYS